LTGEEQGEGDKQGEAIPRMQKARARIQKDKANFKNEFKGRVYRFTF